MASAVSGDDVKGQVSATFAVLDIYSQIMREMIHNIIPPKGVSRLIKNEVNQTFMKHLNREERRMISMLDSGGFNDLDLLCLYKVIRYFNLLPPPTKGWGQQPQPGDQSEGDDIERMRSQRNNIVHRHRAILTESERNIFFQESIEIAKRMDNKIGSFKNGFESRIQNVQSNLLSREKFIEAIEKSAEYQGSLKEETQSPMFDLYYGNDITIKLEVKDNQKEKGEQSNSCTIVLKDPRIDVNSMIQKIDKIKEYISKNDFVFDEEFKLKSVLGHEDAFSPEGKVDELKTRFSKRKIEPLQEDKFKNQFSDHGQASDLPPQREEGNDTFTTIQNVPSSITKQPITQPTQGITHVPQSRDRKNSDRDYVPLTNCRTGTVSRNPRLLRADSVDSVPDETAPPPPVKRGQVIEDDVFHTQVYDVPPKAHFMNVTMPALKICTSSESSSKDDSTLDVYDVPAPGHPRRHSLSTPRLSRSESHKGDSAYSSQSVLTYDYPPSSEKNVLSDETYDYPPTNPHSLPKMDDIPPVRLPPPKSYLQHQEPYQNISPNSKMLNEGIDSLDINKIVPMSTNLSANVPLSYDFPSNNASTQSAYDFPTSGQSGSSLLVIPPPGCGIDSHSYINAATRPVSHAHEDMYLAMDGLVPPAVADRTSSISDSGKSHDSYTLMSEVNVYDHPPPQRPPRISKVIPKPCNGDAYTNIYKNERTRSFKKNNTINNPPFDFPSGRDPYAGKISRSLQHSIPLPKNNNPHPDLTTSSEDEEDDRIADIDQSQNWNKVPPPMKSEKDELKYLELDLVDQPTSQPIHLTHAETGNNTPTEYREIDFVKTTALREVKKTVEGQRKHDEN